MQCAISNADEAEDGQQVVDGRVAATRHDLASAGGAAGGDADEEKLGRAFLMKGALAPRHDLAYAGSLSAARGVQPRQEMGGSWTTEHLPHTVT